MTLYSTDNAELASLLNMRNEFERRGYRVFQSQDLNQKSEIGIYAIHANHFYDFDLGILKRPNSLFSVSMLHDFGQDNGEQHNYFRNDTWEIYDFGLVINDSWGQFLKRAISNGVKGPLYGFAIGGYPKSDDWFIKMNSSEVFLSPELSTTKKIKVLLACSWQNREHLTMAINAIDSNKYQIVSKAFDYETNFTAMIDSPWKDVFIAQREEGRLLNSFYGLHPEIIPLAPETKIFDAIESCDVVVSNGSNVMFESILSLKPAICVTDWSQPAGLHGEETVYSKINSPGIINVVSKDLNEAIELSLSLQSRKLLSHARESLLEPNYRGRGAEISVNEILSAFDNVVISKNRDWVHAYAEEEIAVQYFTEIHKYQQKFSSVANQRDSSLSTELPTKELSQESKTVEVDLAERDSAIAERDSILFSGIWKATKPYRWIRDKF